MNIGCAIPIVFARLQQDIYSMTQVIAKSSEFLTAIQNGMDLESVCTAIRTQMQQAKCRANNNQINVRVRRFTFKGDDDNIIIRMASKAENIEEDFKGLDSQFKDALQEQEQMEFIKKCANFHFDFIKVHPFSDANGRTSRILMSMMLATRNIVLPSLYTCIYDKCDFYARSDAALRGDYSVIQAEVFERIGHFYPIILPDLRGNASNISGIDREACLREIQETRTREISPVAEAERVSEKDNSNTGLSR